MPQSKVISIIPTFDSFQGFSRINIYNLSLSQLTKIFESYILLECEDGCSWFGLVRRILYSFQPHVDGLSIEFSRTPISQKVFSKITIFADKEKSVILFMGTPEHPEISEFLRDQIVWFEDVKPETQIEDFSTDNLYEHDVDKMVARETKSCLELANENPELFSGIKVKPAKVYPFKFKSA